MSGPLRTGLGILLVLVGALWTLQGLGVVGGSVMSGVTLWAIIGPLVVLAGLALVVTGRRGGTPRPLTTPTSTGSHFRVGSGGSAHSTGRAGQVRSGSSVLASVTCGGAGRSGDTGGTGGPGGGSGTSAPPSSSWNGG